MEPMATEKNKLVNSNSDERVDYDALFGKDSDEKADARPTKFAEKTVIGEVSYKSYCFI